MSLFLPLSSADQYHAKPMAISSITSPSGVHSTSTGGEIVYKNNNSPLNVRPSPSSSSTHSDTVSPPPTSSKSESSSPQSRSFSNCSASSSTSSFSSSPTNSNSSSSKHGISGSNSALPPPPTVSYYHHPYRHCSASSSRVASNEVDNAISAASAPLSLHERRLRNKTASAKYRAKKNQQHGEMRAMISSLTKENELLLRQLDHVQHENGHLKATCDRLRGKIMAQKMLKQYFVETEQQQQYQQQHPGSSNTVPGASTTANNNCFTHYHTTSAIGHNNKFPEIEERGD